MRAIAAALAARYESDEADDEDLDELGLERRGLHASESRRTISPPYGMSEREARAPWLMPIPRRYADLPELERESRQGRIRQARRARVELLGHVDESTPWNECPEAMHRVDELFPDGMSFAEIGRVLGCRKQQAFKIFLHAIAKLREAFGDDVEEILEALRDRDAPAPWESLYRAE